MTADNEKINFWEGLQNELNLPKSFSVEETASKYLGEKKEALKTLLIEQIKNKNIGHIYRILVIGQIGVGKSSLVNLLNGEEVAKVSDNISGCTLDRQVIITMYDQKIFEIIDTIGLNESIRKEVHNQQTVSKHFNLIGSSQRGFNLLLFVMRKGRIYEMFENSFKQYANIVSSSKIPAILFISHCEDDDPIDAWLKKDNNDYMLLQYHFAEIICGTTKSGGRFEAELEPLLQETKSAVWNSILEKMSKQPKHIPKNSIIQSCAEDKTISENRSITDDTKTRHTLHRVRQPLSNISRAVCNIS